MARIYLTGSGPTKGYTTGSGIISNPVRILLQEKDSHTGSYPTIARTGDPDFTGVYPSFYDDTNTINFVGHNQTVYPTAVPATSRWVSGGIATPNILQGLTTVGSASKGVADSHVSFTPGQNLSPFNESRIYVDNDSAFYQTGTDASILPGFDQKLGSKSSVVIELPYDDTTSSRVLQDDPGIETNSRMAYFSFTTRQWEYVGLKTLNAGGSNQELLEKTSRGFSPSIDVGPFGNQYALPISNYGFPIHPKFHAKEEFLYCMSASISSPFLVEKIVYEGFVGNNEINSGGSARGAIHSFFALRQFKGKLQNFAMTANNTAYTITASVPSYLLITSSDLNETYIDTLREIVSYANVGFISPDPSDSAPIKNAYSSSCDFLIDNETAGFPSYRTCSKIRVEFVPKSCFKHEAALGEIGDATGLFFMGGRGFGLDGSGRPFLSPIPVGPSFLGTATDATYTVPSAIVSGTAYVDSPYLLLPNDKLLFGWNSCYSGLAGSDGAISPSLTLKSGKVTFFGSFLQNNQSISPETNQPLTSDAIHEDLHYDSPVFDQFDVESYSAFYSSYVDLIITGSMLATPLGDPLAANVRKVCGSIVAGQAGTTGSLQRFVQLTSETDKFFDSVLSNFTGSDGSKPLLANSSYGLADGRNKFSNTIARRDRVGQFRDVFQQSTNTCYNVDTAVERPIQIRFMSRPDRSGTGRLPVADPTQTHSQNLSNFATSSLPYFDGDVRDRTDNPDITLTSVTL